MAAAKDYQRYATRCVQEARFIADARPRGFLVEMAQAWQRLAAERVTNVRGGQDRFSRAENEVSLIR